MEETIDTCRAWFGNLRERNHLEELGVDGRAILKCLSKESFGRAWVD
jgi:hypothetical protein